MLGEIIKKLGDRNGRIGVKFLSFGNFMVFTPYGVGFGNIRDIEVELFEDVAEAKEEIYEELKEYLQKLSMVPNLIFHVICKDSENVCSCFAFGELDQGDMSKYEKNLQKTLPEATIERIDNYVYRATLRVSNYDKEIYQKFDDFEEWMKELLK